MKKEVIEQTSLNGKKLSIGNIFSDEDMPNGEKRAASIISDRSMPANTDRLPTGEFKIKLYHVGDIFKIDDMVLENYKLMELEPILATEHKHKLMYITPIDGHQYHVNVPVFYFTVLSFVSGSGDKLHEDPESEYRIEMYGMAYRDGFTHTQIGEYGYTYLPNAAFLSKVYEIVDKLVDENTTVTLDELRNEYKNNIIKDV